MFELSAKNRTVLELYYYEGYSINEIADILKIGVNSVTSRLSRARKNLNWKWRRIRMNKRNCTGALKELGRTDI